MSKNDITGDNIITKPSNDAYADGWDRIFGKKKELTVEDLTPVWEKQTDAMWQSEAKVVTDEGPDQEFMKLLEEDAHLDLNRMPLDQ